MVRFPLYIDMKGRKVIIAGGGAVALRKAGVLADFGADIIVISPECHEGLIDMEKQRILSCEKRYLTAEKLECLDEAFMVICATGDRKLNAAIAAYCRMQGIWTDCADSEKNSSCIFPSVVRRKEIVIGISTSGGVPALTRHLKQKIERLVPEWYGELEKVLRVTRDKLKQSDASQDEKRKTLNDMIEEAERRHPEC